jgi:hypothetical protein
LVSRPCQHGPNCSIKNVTWRILKEEGGKGRIGLLDGNEKCEECLCSRCR